MNNKPSGATHSDFVEDTFALLSANPLKFKKGAGAFLGGLFARMEGFACFVHFSGRDHLLAGIREIVYIFDSRERIAVQAQLPEWLQSVEELAGGSHKLIWPTYVAKATRMGRILAFTSNRGEATKDSATDARQIVDLFLSSLALVDEKRFTGERDAQRRELKKILAELKVSDDEKASFAADQIMEAILRDQAEAPR